MHFIGQFTNHHRVYTHVMIGKLTNKMFAMHLNSQNPQILSNAKDSQYIIIIVVIIIIRKRYATTRTRIWREESSVDKEIKQKTDSQRIESKEYIVRQWRVGVVTEWVWFAEYNGWVWLA